MECILTKLNSVFKVVLIITFVGLVLMLSSCDYYEISIDPELCGGTPPPMSNDSLYNHHP